jgi:hypothetical protein
LIQPTDLRIIPDIKSADGVFNFTDGSGEISEEFAQIISAKLGIDHVPSVFQVFIQIAAS